MADENKDLKDQGAEDTLVGKAKQAAGQVQAKVGDVTGNTEAQVKGREKQVEGTGQSTVGNIKDKVGDALSHKGDE